MKMNNFQKIQETKLHAIPRFPAGIICGPVWGSLPVRGSFAVGNHLRRCASVNLSKYFNKYLKSGKRTDLKLGEGS